MHSFSDLISSFGFHDHCVPIVMQLSHTRLLSNAPIASIGLTTLLRGNRIISSRRFNAERQAAVFTMIRREEPMPHWVTSPYFTIAAAIVWLVLADDLNTTLRAAWPRLDAAWKDARGTVARIRESVHARFEIREPTGRALYVGAVGCLMLLVLMVGDAIVLGYSIAAAGLANEALPVLDFQVSVAPVLAIVLSLFNAGAGVVLGELEDDAKRRSKLLVIVAVAILGQAGISFWRGVSVVDSPNQMLNVISGTINAMLAAALAAGEVEVARRIHKEIIYVGLVLQYLVLLVVLYAILGAAGVIALLAMGVVSAMLVLNWVPLRLHHWTRLTRLHP